MRIGSVINPASGRRGRQASAGLDRLAIAERFADRRHGVDIEAVLTTAAAADGRVLMVAYTLRSSSDGETIRLISARRASRRERAAYAATN